MISRLVFVMAIAVLDAHRCHPSLIDTTCIKERNNDLH